MTAFLSRRFWVGVAFSILCLWLALRNVPFTDLGRSVATAQYIWLLPTLVSQFLAVAARAQRWAVLLGKEERLVDSFHAQAIGYLFTNVFPLRLGEPARVIAMSQRCGLPLVQVGASAVVERLLDIATMLLVLALVLPWMQVPPLVFQAGLSFAILILLAPAFILFLVRCRQGVERVLQRVFKYVRFLPADAAIARWRELVDGLVPLVRWKIALKVVSWSLVTWALSILTYWFVLRSFEAEAAVLEAAFMLVVLAFAVTVPSSPGFIGVFQLAGQQALVLPFGGKYDPATALAITLTAHVAYYVFTTGLGVIGLWKLGESFTGLGRLVKVGRPSLKATSREVPS